MIVIKPAHPDAWMDYDKLPLLNEMSLPRKEIERMLLQNYEVRYTHLLKLFYFRHNVRDFNGWSTSVWKVIISLPKIKNPIGKDKLPDAQFIYEWLWGNLEDSFSNWHRVTLRGFNTKSDPEYKDLPYIHAGGDEETAAEFVKAYHIWLAKQLSKDGKVEKTDVQDEIKELLKKYSYK